MIKFSINNYFNKINYYIYIYIHLCKYKYIYCIYIFIDIFLKEKFDLI